MDSDEDILTIVRTYLRSPDDDARYEAWEAITIPIDADPERAWRFIRCALREAEGFELGTIGAGPLEELLVQHGELLLGDLLAEVRENPKFVEAYLSMYFDDIPETVWRTLNAALIESGVAAESLEWATR